MDFLDLVLHQHYNFSIWHTEESGRSIPSDDHVIADAHRNIHLYHTCRYVLIEQIDLGLHAGPASARAFKTGVRRSTGIRQAAALIAALSSTVRTYHREEETMAMPACWPE